MSGETKAAISVQCIGKRYCRDLKRSLYYGVQDVLDDLCGRSLDRRDIRPKEFWANKEVSFEVTRGECVGLIGHNGAGKTTLLKMLNGLIKPDKGNIRLHGRVGALIALGAGFNPVLTGRENIYINGAVLGLSRREVHAKLEEIIDFAEIGEFIDAPVRSYSSGMQVRLGFAVATALNPDILLIDEVLAVGDLDFRMKCISRIRDLINDDTAVILVSHSMVDIQRVCTRTLVMDHGDIVYDGEVSRGISHYESIGHRIKKDKISRIRRSRENKISAVGLFAKVNDGKEESGEDFEMMTGDNLKLRLRVQCSMALQGVRVRIYIDSSQAGIISSLSTASQIEDLSLDAGIHDIGLAISAMPLRVGAYSLGASVHTGDNDVLMAPAILGILRVVGPPALTSAKGDAGLIKLDSAWDFRASAPQAKTSTTLSSPSTES